MNSHEIKDHVSKDNLPLIWSNMVGHLPAELFRKDLISAMKVSDPGQLRKHNCLIITDSWRNEWERGVQVPVNPDKLHKVGYREVKGFCKTRGNFKIPQKLLCTCKDSECSLESHVFTPVSEVAEAVCRYDLDELDSIWLEELNSQRAINGLRLVEEEIMENLIEEFEMQAKKKLDEKLRAACRTTKYTPKTKMKGHPRCGEITDQTSNIDEDSIFVQPIPDLKKQNILQSLYKFIDPHKIAAAKKFPIDVTQVIFQYWKLKRKSMFDKVLLKAKYEDIIIMKRQHENHLIEQMRTLLRLRKDLERARNLCYMISRREKLKRENQRVMENIWYEISSIVNNGNQYKSEDLLSAYKQIKCKDISIKTEIIPQEILVTHMDPNQIDFMDFHKSFPHLDSSFKMSLDDKTFLRGNRDKNASIYPDVLNFKNNQKERKSSFKRIKREDINNQCVTSNNDVSRYGHFDTYPDNSVETSVTTRAQYKKTCHMSVDTSKYVSENNQLSKTCTRIEVKSTPSTFTDEISNFSNKIHNVNDLCARKTFYSKSKGSTRTIQSYSNHKKELNKQQRTTLTSSGKNKKSISSLSKNFKKSNSKTNIYKTNDLKLKHSKLINKSKPSSKNVVKKNKSNLRNFSKTSHSNDSKSKEETNRYKLCNNSTGKNVSQNKRSLYKNCEVLYKLCDQLNRKEKILMIDSFIRNSKMFKKTNNNAKNHCLKHNCDIGTSLNIKSNGIISPKVKSHRSRLKFCNRIINNELIGNKTLSRHSHAHRRKFLDPAQEKSAKCTNFVNKQIKKECKSRKR